MRFLIPGAQNTKSDSTQYSGKPAEWFAEWKTSSLLSNYYHIIFFHFFFEWLLWVEYPTGDLIPTKILYDRYNYPILQIGKVRLFSHPMSTPETCPLGPSGPGHLVHTSICYIQHKAINDIHADDLSHEEKARLCLESSV